MRAITPALVNDAIEETRHVLRRVRNVKPGDEDNFEFFSSQSLIDNFNEVTVGVKIGAFVLGIIALVVAGIGIMNIMLVAVTERTKEIGIRKSIGARRSSILRQFLLEAVILCNVGGLIGVAVGFGLRQHRRPVRLLRGVGADGVGGDRPAVLLHGGHRLRDASGDQGVAA